MGIDSIKDVGCNLMSVSGNSSDTTKNQCNSEVAFKIDRLEIFRVKSCVDANATSEGAYDQSRYAPYTFEGSYDQDRYAPYTSENKIKGEQLLERIQGFGSDAR